MLLNKKNRYIVMFISSLFISQCAHAPIIPNTFVNNNTCLFRYVSESAHSVNLVGSFNDWGAYPLQMKKIDKQTWEISITLKPGIYYYQFLVDNKNLIIPPNADEYSNDGFEGKNAVVIILQK